MLTSSTAIGGVEATTFRKATSSPSFGTSVANR